VFHKGWDMRCSCGETMGDCSFWQAWRREAERQGIEFNPGALGVNVLDPSFSSFWDRLYFHQFPYRAIDRARDWMYGPRSPQRKRINAALDKSVQLAKILCDMEGTNVFFDTTKHPDQVRFLARRPQLDFRMISLVRDGRGVMCSLMNRYGFSPERAVNDFVWGNKHRLRSEAYVSDDRIFRLRLEDLCAAPDSTIRALRTFAGIDPDAPADYAQGSRHIMGNLMRLTFDGVIRQDDSWKTSLTKEHLALFESRAGRLNRSFGYED
jgi:hypothetical protein